VLQDDDGHPPVNSVLNAISFALNQFHDQWAIHMNEAMTWLHTGRTILLQLTMTNQLGLIAKTGKGGKKEQVDWEAIAAQLVIIFS